MTHERIWVDTADMADTPDGAYWTRHPTLDGNDIEYVRADLIATLQAEARELRERLTFAVKLLRGFPVIAGTAQVQAMEAALNRATVKESLTAQPAPAERESLPLTFTQGVLCSLSILDRYGDSIAYREVADPHDLNQLWEEADEFDREHLARHGYRPTPAAQEGRE